LYFESNLLTKQTPFVHWIGQRCRSSWK